VIVAVPDGDDPLLFQGRSITSLDVHVLPTTVLCASIARPAASPRSRSATWFAVRTRSRSVHRNECDQHRRTSIRSADDRR